jgi:hypothetical protein
MLLLQPWVGRQHHQSEPETTPVERVRFASKHVLKLARLNLRHSGAWTRTSCAGAGRHCREGEEKRGNLLHEFASLPRARPEWVNRITPRTAWLPACVPIIEPFTDRGKCVGKIGQA